MLSDGLALWLSEDGGGCPIPFGNLKILVPFNERQRGLLDVQRNLLRSEEQILLHLLSQNYQDSSYPNSK